MKAESKTVLQIVSATALVSGAYAIVFVLTFVLVEEIYADFAPQFANFTSLIFLPHGVRVLSAWLFRWRAVPYLLPGVLAGHLFNYGPVMTPQLFLGMVVGLVCAPLAFALMDRIGLAFRPGASQRTHWRDIVLTGAVASVFNSVLTSLAYGNGLATTSARFLGDIGGTVVCLAILLVVLRLRDRMRWG